MNHSPQAPGLPGPARPAITTRTPVSVVMPVRNEERHLEEAVRSVLGQDYPAAIEVVLAVGPSRDRTRDIAERLAQADARITVVANPSGRIPNAVNAAIKVSRYPIIARLDGHALIPVGYLQQAVRTLQETGADNVGGIMAAEGGTPFEEAVAWAMTSKAGVGGARFHTGGRAGPVDSVYLGVYRRAAIEQVGGYDEAYQRAEDWEMNHRIRLSGGLIWFQPKLRVTYRPRASVAALGAQYFHYGRWRRVVARQHAGTINLRYLAPPVAVLALVAGTLVGLAGLVVGPGWLTAGFIAPAAYIAGVLAVAAMAARSAPARVVARIPLVLPTMHVCWGVGFLTSPRALIPGRVPSGGPSRLEAA
jgi:succinoglycan biosynthesis protein ExoA